MGISRDRAYVWWRRYRSEGHSGLEDRSSRPHRSPKRTRPAKERQVVRLRQQKGLGPARIAGMVAMPASTVHRVLVRHQLNRLDHLDRVTRVPIRRMTAAQPGELVHVDIKKLGRVPQGGGWRVNGRAGRVDHRRAGRTPPGYAFVHSAIDAHSRLAYSEVLTDEQGPTAAAFWTRAQAFFFRHGITIERVLTDNGPCYRSKDFNKALGTTTHTFTRPYRPQTNGKVERFNRTLLAEWAYARPWSSDSQRTRALTTWLHLYNHHRHHTAIGSPPIRRVSNLPGHYS